MSRVSRVVVPGYPHYVTQRGNDGGIVFRSEKRIYLDLIGELSAKYVHLVAVPGREISMVHVMRRADLSFAQYSHARHGASGHFWQSRSYSCPMDDPHRWAVLAYVEQNPVRAGMVRKAEDYHWSSATAHIQDSGAGGSLQLEDWRREFTAPAGRGQGILCHRWTRIFTPICARMWPKTSFAEIGEKV